MQSGLQVGTYASVCGRTAICTSKHDKQTETKTITFIQFNTSIVMYSISNDVFPSTHLRSIGSYLLAASQGEILQ